MSNEANGVKERSKIDILVERIRSSLLQNPGRRISSVEDSKLSKAAVTMLLRPDYTGGQLVTLLIKRSGREGDPWSGNMAFPGGRSESGDASILATAIREMFEETSIDLKGCIILGTLDEIKASNFDIYVTPFVALSPEKISVTLDEREIETFVWIPLSFFIDKRNSTPYSIPRMGVTLEVPSYHYLGQHVVWGMTFRIIQDFMSKIGNFDDSVS